MIDVFLEDLSIHEKTFRFAFSIVLRVVKLTSMIFGTIKSGFIR